MVFTVPHYLKETIHTNEAGIDFQIIADMFQRYNRYIQ